MESPRKLELDSPSRSLAPGPRSLSPYSLLLRARVHFFT